MTKPYLILICSVALEAEPVLASLVDPETLRCGGKPAIRGTLAGTKVLLVTGGMGKTNAAHALTAALESTPASGVVGFGVAGAYPRSDLEVGDVALATSEIYGDEGVATPDGWISTQGIGIPLVDRVGQRLFNEMPVDAAAVGTATAALKRAGIAHAKGPFVTVSACSGTSATGAALAARFGAVCESMEGAAYAHVAALYGVPYIGVRGISNLVEDRDLSSWRLADAAEATARAIEIIARNDFQAIGS